MTVTGHRLTARTLVFQSNNEGSTPSGPIITFKFFKNIFFSKNCFLFSKRQQRRKYAKTRFQFCFITLVSPFVATTIFFKNQLLTREQKILIKQSYILMMWFYYISFTNSEVTEKYQLKFFFTPIKKYIFTETKAPMAHKNRSKEQYQKKMFKLKITFNSFFFNEDIVKNANLALLFLLITKQNFPVFETNLVFLKYYTFFFFFQDLPYFNYYSLR